MLISTNRIIRCRHFYKSLRVFWTRSLSSDSKCIEQRVFSGIQPTGIPHLGNYFGAIKKWKELQDEDKYTCIFSIVDLHAITLNHEPEKLKENILLMTACLLACGIDCTKCILFLQSKVPYHTQLAWILGCLVTVPQLSRLPQYKEKTEKLKDIPLGLFIYPVLQAADILLYKSNLVPIGEDQMQHIHLARRLSEVFNNKFQTVFQHPKPLIDPKAARLKSLRHPDKKMSKSETNPIGRIDLTDSPETISEKIKKALTDFTSAVTFDPQSRPGVSNLISIHSLFTGLSPEQICEQNQTLDTAQYKMVVADSVIEVLTPIQKRIKELLTDKSYLSQVLDEGADRASGIALKTMQEVILATGLYPNDDKR